MFRTTVIIALLALVQPIVAADAPSKYALFVGVSKYQHADMNKPQLEFPETDAKELADIFKKAGYTVDLLLGKQATQEAIKAKLSQLKKKSDTDGVIVIGLFGHGIEFDATNLACFCPYDTTMRPALDAQGRKVSNETGGTRIEPDPESLVTMEDILTGLRISPAGNRILLADCCRNDPKKARGRAFGSNVKLTDLPRNTAALFACSEDEKAFEHREWGHGAFTKCLIDELKARPANGRITANQLSVELESKVKNLVASISGGRDRQTVSPLVNGIVDFQMSASIIPLPPALLIAPFDRAKAESAQEAWAKARGINVISKNSIGAEMVLIPPGEFMMGDEDSVEELLKLFPYANKKWFGNAKQHQVRITKAFQLGKHEVTVHQFRQFVEATAYMTDPEKDGQGGWGYDSEKKELVQGNQFNWRNTGIDPSPKADYPVVNVSWHDAVAFCNWGSRKEGKKEYYRIEGNTVTVVGGTGYRLPTEAQWEYACRAGTITRYSSGSDPEGLVRIGNVWDSQAKTEFLTYLNFLTSNDGFAFMSPVGRFSVNNFGLHDMTGNVSEWCGDWFTNDYDATAVDDPEGAVSGTKRTVRGGSWQGNAAFCRSAFRTTGVPSGGSILVGFRLAATPE